MKEKMNWLSLIFSTVFVGMIIIMFIPEKPDAQFFLTCYIAGAAVRLTSITYEKE